MAVPILSPSLPSRRALTRGSAYGRLPEEMSTANGAPFGPSLFRRLQRPWLWEAEAPRFGKRLRWVFSTEELFLPTIRSSQVSMDGTTKVLLDFSGDRTELVHMPRHVSSERVTLCVSSQVGCAMGCAFCATARLGMRRNLSAGEIVGQVLVVLRALGPRHSSALSLVFMGMGEPLHNGKEVARAIEVLAHPDGLAITPRRMTVSTVGLVPEIERLGRLTKRPHLAVSLNATTDELRSQLMPVNRKYPLAMLKSALERYPVGPKDRILIEYVLMRGLNDRLEDAARLSEFVSGFPHHINLIPFNPFAGAPFEAPRREDIDRFAKAILGIRPTLVTVRTSRGRDIDGACGQLARREGLNASS
ncbi:MAG: 23S rRNA (adenine(2503)-C(2))-methyltransferase RlmN [Polyangiaceae bacterium]